MPRRLQWKPLTHTSEHAIFARRLRAILGEQNISGGELAANLGVTPAAVCRWLNGQRLPSARLLEALKQFLGVRGNLIF